jgi:hypothetical protein
MTFLLFLGVALWPQPAMAVPSFARKYQTSCQTCHVAPAKLNAFGRAFEANGFRFPAGQDAEMVKSERLPLGSESYKKVFPKAVWPTDIALFSPVSMWVIMRANITPDKAETSEFDFPHEIELFVSDTIGQHFSYFVEVAWDAGELEGDAWLQYDLNPAFHVRMGAINPQSVEFREKNRLTAKHYNYAESAPDDSVFELGAGSGGLELWGAVNGPGGKGGLRYRGGLVNGHGANDNNSAKDYYAGLEYKFLGMGQAGGADSAGSDKPYVDNSVTLGALWYSGKETLAGYDDAYDFLVGTVSGWWGPVNILALYQDQTNDNPANAGEVKTKAWFLEVDYVALPWLIPLVRYQSTEFGSSPAQELLIPHITMLATANIRFFVEGQLRLDDAGADEDKYVVGVNWGF